MEKWTEMLNNYDSYLTKKYSKLKSRTRKGIPDCYRGFVWKKFAKIEEIKATYCTISYETLNSQIIEDNRDEICILKDIGRTFPLCSLFSEKYGLGY